MTASGSFSDKVIRHFREPENVGTIKNADGIGYVLDTSWGSDLELYIRVENGIIIDAKFKAYGCSTSIAACSVVTELIKGKGVEEALRISEQAVDEALGGLPVSKQRYAALGQELIKLAIEDYRNKGKR
jgi:nitrogen fixation NifU-like protein